MLSRHGFQDVQASWEFSKNLFCQEQLVECTFHLCLYRKHYVWHIKLSHTYCVYIYICDTLCDVTKSCFHLIHIKASFPMKTSRAKSHYGSLHPPLCPFLCNNCWCVKECSGRIRVGSIPPRTNLSYAHMHINDSWKQSQTL